MSVTELNRLKTTLEEIDKIRRKDIPEMSEKISDFEEKKVNQLNEISAREKRIEKSILIEKGQDEWKKDAQKKIKRNNKLLEKAREELTDFESEVLPEIAEQSVEINRLKYVNHGLTILVISGIVMILLLVMGVVNGVAEARDLPRGEWVCDNGEVIALLDVMDYTYDCSDRSDEEVKIRSDSRAQEAQKSEEYSKLLDEKNNKFWEVMLQVSWPGYIVFVLGFVYWGLEYRFKGEKLHALVLENNKLKDKQKSLRDKVKSWDNKNASIEGKNSSRLKEIASIKNQKAQLDAALKELNMISSQIEKAETERTKYVEKEMELWESIRDIIPLGDATNDIL